MNQLFIMLAALALVIQPCAAQSRQSRPAAFDQERPEPRVNPVRVQAAALTSYFADRLRLQARQQPAVQHCVHQHLEELTVLDWQAAGFPPAEAHLDSLTRQYHASLRRVLTAGQFNNFMQLKEYQLAPSYLPADWLAAYGK
ncbi:hypothetical protein [Hymenobacter sp. B1770]|uniref:hypothetical protein n=1 Tax=Hymenobacter sp. B1770 TaxID=1718788 RepID=UPI003CF52A06